MRRHEADEYIKMLAHHYPKTFFETGQRRMPLKIGIDVDIQKDGSLTDLTTINDIIYFYVGHIGYSYNTKAGVSRLDLDGNPCEKVTESEQRAAEQKIEEFNEFRNKNLREYEVVEKIPVLRRAIPAAVLPTEEQALFNRVEALMSKARSLRMEDEDLGAELAVKALELARVEVDNLITKYRK